MIKGPYAHPYISRFVLSPQCSVSSGRLLAWLSVCEMETCICPSWCHCHSLSLASVKSRLVLPFWYWLTRVVPEKGPLNGCVCVCALSPLQLSRGTTYSRRPPSLLGRERNCLNGLPAGLRLLLLLLLMACAPSRHRVHLATVIDLPGKVESVDRGSASVVPKISSCACRMPGQSSQYSSICGAWLHLGQLGSTVLSKCFYAWRRIQWPDLSWANSMASFLDAIPRRSRCSLWSA